LHTPHKLTTQVRAGGERSTTVSTRAQRNASPPTIGSTEHILDLQHSVGNQATLNMLRAPSATLYDADPARAAHTKRLVGALNASLALNTKHLTIRSDQEASRHTIGGSGGLTHANTVILNPAVYDGRSQRSRELLAHELAHIAQLQQPEIAGITQSQAGWLAEVEAGLVARDFAAGRRIDPIMLGRPRDQWAAFSLPDLASMEALQRIKQAIANGVSSRVGDRPAAAFIVRSMTRWAGGDLRGAEADDATPNSLGQLATLVDADTAADSDSVGSATHTRRAMRQADPTGFQQLRQQERSAVQQQRGIERDIRGELRSDRHARRESAGRAQRNGADVVLALTRALVGVGAEALHATPLFPLQLKLAGGGLQLDLVADVRLRGVEVSGAIDTNFLGIPLRIGDTTSSSLGGRERSALRRARQLAIHFPWLSLDVYGTLPATELSAFASGPGYFTPSHLTFEWLRFGLPGMTSGPSGLASGLLGLIDWGGSGPPQLKVTNVHLGRGRGLEFDSIGFAAGPVDISAFAGLVSVQDMEVIDGTLSDGALQLTLSSEAVVLQLLGRRGGVAQPSIHYDSRQGLSVSFGALDLGKLSVASGVIGPGRQARFSNGRVTFGGGEGSFNELVVEPGGMPTFVEPRPKSLSAMLGLMSTLVAVPSRAATVLPAARQKFETPDTEVPGSESTIRRSDNQKSKQSAVGANDYQVKAGESPLAIAEKLDLSVADLVAANPGKLRTWPTAGGGKIEGFNAGELLTIPIPRSTLETPTKSGTESGPPSAFTAFREKVGSAATGVWNWFAGEAESPTASNQSTVPELKGQVTQTGAQDPRQVVNLHNSLGTFGEDQAHVTSTVRDPQKQLNILRTYCKGNARALDNYAKATDWLKGELDWPAFETCSISDELIWLPFFFALYYGGGGPSTKSEDRTLPLVGSPVQATWKGRKANASPHLAGRAMDMQGGDLDTLAKIVETKIPEFTKDIGAFPVRSTQKETVKDQRVLHINFEHPVFPVGENTKPEDKGTI
jgi:Domain of unknown function (DUF4157)